jgi:F-type H+-transporting ATPase subunit b
MGHFDAFGFFVSLVNFGLMFVLFFQVVIAPMEDAVAKRQRKVTEQLDDIRLTLAQAEKIEAEVKAQFARLEDEKQEMTEATNREIARFREQTLSTAEKDAEHLVGKTRRECEKNRQETLAALNQQLANQAMSKVEGLLAKAFDAQAQDASVENVLGKVGQGAS